MLQPIEFDIVTPKIKLGYSYMAYYLIKLGLVGMCLLSIYYVIITSNKYFQMNDTDFEIIFWVISVSSIITLLIFLGKLEEFLFPLTKTGNFVIQNNRFIIYTEGNKEEILFESLEHIRKTIGIGTSRLSPLAYDLKFVNKDYSTYWVRKIKAKNADHNLYDILRTHKELQRLQIEVF